MLCYCALHKEADPSAIVKQAWAEGKRVAFPWCGENWRMEALEPLKEDAFLVGRHGIIAPDPARSRVIPPEELDLIVVPGLAFDKIGGRLGRGAGYYDRYLSQTAAIFVGFCLENQVVPHVPMDAHDVRLHLIAAPNGVFDTGNRWAARNI